MNETILLVDDEEGIRKVLGISLRDRGYSVTTAENGQQALDLFTRLHPDIVITDIKMPGMDGIDLLRRLKQENPDVEVIIITGHGDMDLAIKSLKYEATDFITKPIDDYALDRALQKSWERIRLRSHLKRYTENLESLLLAKTEALSVTSRLSASDGRGEKFFAPSAYHHFFDQLPGYVTIHETDFTLSAANRLFSSDFGFDAASGDRCHMVIKGSDESCLNCPVEQTFRDGKPHQQEMKLTMPHGGARQVLAWTTPLADDSGRVHQVMMMSTDISQIVNLQDHLASLGLMVGSVSHGIKGLLTGLDGGVYLLDSGVKRDDPDKIADGLNTVRLMAGRIRNMVLDILYYAKERKLVRSDVSVAAFAEEAARIVAPKFRDTSVVFRTEIDPALAGIRFSVDADQLRAALVNILENAADACRDDPGKTDHEVFFRVEPAPARDGESAGEGVAFHIMDNGIGMDAKTQEKIFTLFFSSKSTQGTGIGLFVARKVIQQHGGALTVTSEPGKGTRFRIRIPLIEA